MKASQKHPLEIRKQLALKIARALPDLSKAKQTQAFQMAIQALEKLCEDHEVDVRRALSETLKDLDCTPPYIIHKLANDVDQLVASPILQFSKLLTQEDIRAILKVHPESWRLESVSKREDLSPTLAGELITYRNPKVGGILLDHEGNILNEACFEALTDESQEHEILQGKLAVHPAYPPFLAIKLAEFAGSKILKILQRRKDFDLSSANEIASICSDRLSWKKLHPEAHLAPNPNADEEDLMAALSWGEKDYCIASLASRLRVKRDYIDLVLNTQSPKAVTALSWAAGYSMRFAMLLQRKLAGISHRQILNARMGVDYPLSEEEMLWQLDYFGIQMPRRRLA